MRSILKITLAGIVDNILRIYVFKSCKKLKHQLLTHIICFCLIFFFLSSCSIFTEFIEITQKEIDILNNINIYERSKFNNILSDFEKLLDVYDSAVIVIQIKDFINETTGNALYQFSYKNMLISSLNSLGNRVICTSYDNDYITSERNNGGSKKIKRILPDVAIIGGIIANDKCIEKQTGFTFKSILGSGKPETSGNLDMIIFATYSQISIDLNMIDYVTQAMIPKCQAINTINVYQKTKSSKGGIYGLYGSGMGIHKSIVYSQSKNAAIRNLINISVIQLIGRYLNLPYWRILPGGRKDNVVIRNIKQNFNKSSHKNKVFAIQRLLQQNGFSIKINGIYGKKTQQALREYMIKQNIQNTRYVNDQLYFKLMLSVPIH